MFLCAEVVCQCCNTTTGIIFDISLLQAIYHAALTTSMHLLKNYHFHLNGYPLPLIGTAAVVELFVTIDNSSDRQDESFKTVKTWRRIVYGSLRSALITARESNRQPLCSQFSATQTADNHTWTRSECAQVIGFTAAEICVFVDNFHVWWRHEKSSDVFHHNTFKQVSVMFFFRQGRSGAHCV